MSKSFMRYLDTVIEGGDLRPFFTEDVELVVHGMPEIVRGRDEVATALDAMHGAFDGGPEPRAIVVGDRNAAAEAVWVGTHTGTFAGIEATGRQVRVPYAVLYDLTEDGISSLRIHGIHAGLMEQLR
ncbi:ester cyclase [Tenggerimyces flavus]|uniref:Ester cyclase n=1 Tax=Tenggerimyces flavus TaxID=1708749 RepID=A0ABV7YLW9_9ACTN|nr:ester cyclase [Tenggerimyces flavus]MBM7786248.1 putative ester cyclase [Tenggerimyces flavus]